MPECCVCVQKGRQQVGQQVGLAGVTECGGQEAAKQLLVLTQERAAAWLSPMALSQRLVKHMQESPAQCRLEAA